MKKIALILLVSLFTFCVVSNSFAQTRKERREKEIQDLQQKFGWWPTDATPAPVKDEEKGGYWWWPDKPGQAIPWGNRGYIYVYKLIYDYKATDEEEEQKQVSPVSENKTPQPKPSLLIKKILKNVKIYFDYNKAELRDDHIPVLDNMVRLLNKNPETTILITGNCDVRGSSEYNLKLGKKRGEIVKNYMLEKGIVDDRIKIISRGKLDAVAPVTDLVGMQKDRNAQFMVAEVDEVMMTDPNAGQAQDAKKLEEGKYLVEQEEKVETQVKISTREYIVQKNDSLWKIAQKELGSGHRWKYLFEINKETIKNPDKLKAGMKLIIPVE